MYSLPPEPTVNHTIFIFEYLYSVNEISTPYRLINQPSNTHCRLPTIEWPVFIYKTYFHTNSTLPQTNKLTLKHSLGTTPTE